jgi:hypothetical protein
MANTTGKKFGGRKKGTPNKSTTEIRQGFHLLIENNLDKLEDWLEKIAEEDPVKALDMIHKFGDFIVPKLSRSEVTNTTTVDELFKMTPTERAERMKELNKLNNKK